MALITILKSNWFLVGIVIVITLAKVAPDIGSKGGILKPEVTVKYVAVSIIFFNSGISLRTEDLTKAFLQIKVHAFVQGFTFIIFPMLTKLLYDILATGPFDNMLLEGLKVLGCMPPPVSSAVILTKSVAGNEAAAIFNSAFGSFLGIFVTPALILSVVGSKAEVEVTSIFSQLFCTVVLPLIVGQILRKSFKTSLTRTHIPFGCIGSGILLLIIYTTFCDTFSHDDISVDGISLMSIIFLIVILQTILLTSLFFITTWSAFGFHPTDVPALMFCCTHKSLTLGIPIIKIVFSGNPSMSLISIPLLVYHPTQILLGGLLVPTIKGWLLATQRFRRSPMHHV